VPDARAIAIVDGRALVAESPRGLWSSDRGGPMQLRYASSDGALHGLASSGARGWFADGTSLGVVRVDGDGLAHASVSRADVVRADATLVGSASGDVWVLAQGALARLSIDDPSTAPSAWARDVAPIARRVCARCHDGAGDSDAVLTSEEGWAKHRDAIRKRVVVQRDMPPVDHPIGDAERAAIATWVGP
jgi:hypothetical protein